MSKKLLLGFHVSISESISLAFDRATEIGCTTFQIFTRNPRGWKFKPLAEDEVASFVQKRKASDFKYVIAHMPYLPNLATPLKALQKPSRLSLDAEVQRCDALQIDYLVAHLGSHLGKGTMIGVKNVAEACNEALGKSTGKTTLLLENMAGQRNCVGARFEELRMVLDLVEAKERIGVCLDTCHAFAAGFDLSSESAVKRTLSLFDELVGLDQLKVVHLNDSKGPLGSSLDRHEHIGMGQMGEAGFRAFLHYRGIAELPILMETPDDGRRSDREDMGLVKRLAA